MGVELDDLRQELAATQYWLRAIFVASADGVKLDADAIRQTIKKLKSFVPEGRFDPATYDDLAIRRMPHIERIGNDIAETMEAQPGQ